MLLYVLDNRKANEAARNFHMRQVTKSRDMAPVERKTKKGRFSKSSGYYKNDNVLVKQKKRKEKISLGGEVEQARVRIFENHKQMKSTVIHPKSSVVCLTKSFLTLNKVKEN
ncbi:hypothetical protein NECAME_01786 [Necator americanus]|uniref:Uncharacterized protein n=1 Tax=Necator americanus TaxID=51031 RepID=W2TP61_NECAM|nr:hypothetical protein NECAME_01786 [Necator americanus]ETN83479.1 hypothetical protein NECAME_01786 [Necator americanus]